MPHSPAPQRLDYIDIAKGIGILVVLVSHYEAGMKDDFYLGTSSWWFPDILVGILIPIFFICAGYTTHDESVSLSKLKNKAWRLLKPYLFFNILLLVCFRSFSARTFLGIAYSRYYLFTDGHDDPFRMLIAGNYPLWFLTGMVTSYALFYLLLQYQKQAIYIVAIYLLCAHFMTYLPILLPWSIDTAPVLAVFMWGGYVFRQQKVLNASLIYFPLCFIAYLLLWFYGGNINVSLRQYGTSIITYALIGMTAGYVTLRTSILLEHTRLGRALQLIGHHSLTIFSMEIAFIVLANTYLPIFHNRVSQGLLAACIALLGGLAFSLLLHSSDRFKRLLFK